MPHKGQFDATYRAIPNPPEPPADVRFLSSIPLFLHSFKVILISVFFSGLLLWAQIALLALTVTSVAVGFALISAEYYAALEDPSASKEVLGMTIGYTLSMANFVTIIVIHLVSQHAPFSTPFTIQ